MPKSEYEEQTLFVAISRAAEALDTARETWLNPPEYILVTPEVVNGYSDRTAPKIAECAVLLQERTLTKLYNTFPTWLEDLHTTLDEAVADAYGWPNAIDIDVALASLLSMNLARSAQAGVANSLSTDGTLEH